MAIYTLSLLLQHFQEGGESIAVAGFGETSHRLSAHGEQLEFLKDLAHALWDDAGVGVHHLRTPDPAQADSEERPS